MQTHIAVALAVITYIEVEFDSLGRARVQWVSWQYIRDICAFSLSYFSSLANIEAYLFHKSKDLDIYKRKYILIFSRC